MPFSDATIILAVSGGADSVAMLLAFEELVKAEKLELNLVVAHFNHNLRGAESSDDADFVKKLAEKLSLEIITQNAKSKIQNRDGNLEQNARNARYEFLLETAQRFGAFAVLTAHTLNDQAETFLMRMIRGSGSEGLSAMKTVRTFQEFKNSRFQDSKISELPDFKNSGLEDSISEIEKSEIRNLKSKIVLIRPLLNWAKRIDTENFCRAKLQEYREDSMNHDESFMRVRVRRQLLPMLESFNPKIVETLANTANFLRDDNDFILTEAKKFIGSEFLSVKNLKELPDAIRRCVLRLWIEKHRGNLRQIDLKHIESIERLIFSDKSGREIELPNGEIVARKDGKLNFYEKSS